MLVDDCDHLKIVDLGSAQSFSPGQPLNIEHIEGLMESKGTFGPVDMKVQSELSKTLNRVLFLTNVLTL